jgi:outer membrane protein assembly factor BamD (BamD/ComL family)
VEDISMTYLKALTLSVLLILIVAPTSDVRAQHPGSVNVGGPKRSTDEEIIREAIDLVRRAQWGGSEGLAGAARRLTRLLEDNSDSTTTPLLQALLDGMHEKQAAQSLAIAMFYLSKRDSARVAESRLAEIVRRYPRYSRLDDVLYQLSVIEYESGRRSEAIATLERLVTEFKFSPRTKDALASLRTYRISK